MNDNNLAILGQRIKKRRQQLGLTQEQLAVKIHVNRSEIGNWETGRRGMNIYSLFLVADGLEVSASELLKI